MIYLCFDLLDEKLSLELGIQINDIGFKTSIGFVTAKYRFEVFGLFHIFQDLEPSYSFSLNESSFVKDMQWTKKSDNMYVVLSNLGKLYHGTIGGPVKDIMDNVDAGIFFSFNTSYMFVRYMALMNDGTCFLMCLIINEHDHHAKNLNLGIICLNLKLATSRLVEYNVKSVTFAYIFFLREVNLFFAC